MMRISNRRNWIPARRGLARHAGISAFVPASPAFRRSTSLPYAKICGNYKIISAQYTAEKLQELKATSAQTVADEQLASGIDGDPAWKSKATKLAGDGGEPGKALVAHVAAMTKAFKDHNYASLLTLGGTRAKYLYQEKDSTGATVPAK